MSVAAPLIPAVDAPAFRRALGRFPTGVTLVSSPGGESLFVSAFMSVSLDPPLVALSVGRASFTWRQMRRSPRLGVNVLAGEVDDVRERARPGGDRLAGLAFRTEADGLPRLEDAVAFLRCDVVEERPAGDHLLVLCRVLEVVRNDAQAPLVFCDSRFGSFAA